MIVIVTYENYPDGSAGAIRCKSMADSYMQLGYDVVVIHKGKFKQEYNPKVISCYETNRIKKYFCFEQNVRLQLENLQKRNQLTAVLTYGFFKSINKWCRRNNVTNVVDIVEWYSKEQFKRWYLASAYWRKQIEIRNIVRHKPNVIAISSFLEEYFVNNGCKTVRIPIITDDDIIEKNDVSDIDAVNIIYAGTHPIMDNVHLILKSLLRLPSNQRKRIRLSIYGLQREALLAHFENTDHAVLNECVRFYGKRPHCEVIDAYAHSHFSIFLRDPKLRVNKAGFPSKVVESMKMGVPVLCNYSSDLSLYLQSGLNSVIVADLSENDLCDVFNKVLNFSKADFIKLRKGAICTVRDRFSTEAYANDLLAILN